VKKQQTLSRRIGSKRGLAIYLIRVDTIKVSS
jgi:hypothetical protein